MSLPDNIKCVNASDGGDGSTFFEIEFTDGTSFTWNPDLPYSENFGELPDGSISTGLFIEYSNEHGERVMQGREDSETYNELPPIPAKGY